MLLKIVFQCLRAYFFLGAGAGAGEKPGTGQKRTGSATLIGTKFQFIGL